MWVVEGVLRTSEGPQGDLDTGSLSLLFRFLSILVLSSFISHDGNRSCGDFFFFFLLAVRPENPVSPFYMCRVFFKIVMPSLSCWGEVFHLSLLACCACSYPGWGDISDKNQHFLGWATNCYFGEWPRWDGSAGEGWMPVMGSSCCAVGEGGLWQWSTLIVSIGTMHWAAGLPWPTSFVKSLLWLQGGFPLGRGS